MFFLKSSAAALVFYLPGGCTHTDIEGKQGKARVRNILKSSKKNTIFNEHPVLKSSKDMAERTNNAVVTERVEMWRREGRGRKTKCFRI